MMLMFEKKIFLLKEILSLLRVSFTKLILRRVHADYNDCLQKLIILVRNQGILHLNKSLIFSLMPLFWIKSTNFIVDLKDQVSILSTKPEKDPKSAEHR
jgi:hypothetical protein